MAAYATLADVGEYLPQLTDTAEQAAMAKILERASRMVDRYVGVPDDFFAANAPSPPVNRRFRGTGTRYLPVPPLFSITNVKVDGIDITDYDLLEFYLVRTNQSEIWPLSSEVEITARWGFPAVPPEITEATLEIAVRIWRGRDEAFSGVIGGINRDGSIIERGIPRSAQIVLDEWRVRQAAIFA